jgi:hypothetical protein
MCIYLPNLYRANMPKYNFIVDKIATNLFIVYSLEHFLNTIDILVILQYFFNLKIHLNANQFSHITYNKILTINLFFNILYLFFFTYYYLLTILHRFFFRNFNFIFYMFKIFLYNIFYIFFVYILPILASITS